MDEQLETIRENAERQGDIETLGTALPKAMARVRDDIMPAYREIGPAGGFALALMKADLDRATKALPKGAPAKSQHGCRTATARSRMRCGRRPGQNCGLRRSDNSDLMQATRQRRRWDEAGTEAQAENTEAAGQGNGADTP